MAQTSILKVNKSINKFKHFKMNCLHCLSNKNEKRIVENDIQNAYEMFGVEILNLIDRLQVYIVIIKNDENSSNKSDKETTNQNVGFNYAKKIQKRLLRFVFFLNFLQKKNALKKCIKKKIILI